MKTLEQAKREVIAAGFRVSAGSHETDEYVYAASVESVQGTMGHPRFEVQYRKGLR